MDLLHGSTVLEEVRCWLSSYPPTESCRQEQGSAKKLKLVIPTKGDWQPSFYRQEPMTFVVIWGQVGLGQPTPKGYRPQSLSLFFPDHRVIPAGLFTH